jgi:hypothetical protein
MVPVAYVLSVGPAVWLTHGYGSKTLAGVYQPLALICEHFKLFENAMVWYMTNHMIAVGGGGLIRLCSNGIFA